MSSSAPSAPLAAALVESRPAPHGLGVYARVPIAAGEVVASARGVPAEQGVHTVQVGECAHVLVEAPLVYLNHSCEPNAWLQVPLGGAVVTLRTLVAVAADQELTIDYATFERRTRAFSDVECGCGAARCRDRVLGYEGLSDDNRARLAPWLADYLRPLPLAT